MLILPFDLAIIQHSMWFQLKMPPMLCFACNGAGHKLKDCPDEAKKENYYKSRRQNAQFAGPFNPPEKCRYYLQGRCTRPDCKYLHDDSAAGTVPVARVKIERKDFDSDDQQARQQENEKRIRFADSLIDTNQSFYGLTVILAFLLESF